jgi:hypothetical protein
MTSKELDCGSNILSISTAAVGTDEETGLFKHSLPVSFAEQFPRLVFCSVALSILLATIMTEIDCLRGAGYYWP